MRKKILSLLLLAGISVASVFAQSFTGKQAQQGYGEFSGKVTFIFDEALYGVQPNRVVVTGDFRSWDADLKSTAWDLKKNGGQWILTFDNIDYSVIKPNSGFKFRINESGEWLNPPAGVDNEKGGNLMFEQDVKLAELSAEIRKSDLIWAEITKDRSLNPADYQIKDAEGNIIKVKGVMPNTETGTLIVPAELLDIRRVYYLEIPSQKLKALCSFDGWFREMFSTKELGANIDNGVTDVRVFAPRATAMELYLYKDTKSPAYKIIDMVIDKDGVWETVINEDLHGVYYDFRAHGSKDPGNLFYETTGKNIGDPYARVSDDTWGRCRMWHRTVPATPIKTGIPKMEDVISYEVHVQDFTDNLPIADSLKGTIKAMGIEGLKNKHGEKIGFDYLVDLGVNTIHLMPVQEYMHYPTDDWKESFKDDPYMIEQGVAEENYQWGYRTSFAMAVESRFRVKGAELGSERKDLRDLIQKFHDHGIAVIMDIVPNHTAEDMDENFTHLFNFNGLDKQYYYRTKNTEHIGSYGNEVKTENRPMTQRWIIEQVKYYIDEFGLDGVRIDLAGQIDEQTLKAFRAGIGMEKIVYGEPWIASNDPAYEANPSWDWYKEDSPITYFQDESRTAYKGPVFELNNPLTDRGWSGGKFTERAAVLKGLNCTYKDDKNPNSGISYLDIHDNFTLADQFGRDFDGRDSIYTDEFKIATTLLFTTLGPVVINGGTEMIRSKAHAPLREEVRETKLGFKTYMHGYRDTYNHRTANTYVWNNLGQKPDNKTNFNDYKNMYEFWRGLIAFRNSDQGEIFRQSEAVAEDYYKFILPNNEGMLGYLVKDEVLVLINATQDEQTFENVQLPEGKWQLIATTDKVNHKKGVKSKNKSTKVKGGEINTVNMEPTSLYIWVKK